MGKFKNNNAITLTILIIVIVATVAIAGGTTVVIVSSGILSHKEEVIEEVEIPTPDYSKMTLVEMFKQAKADGCAEGIACNNPAHLHLGDYVNYTPKEGNKLFLSKNETGYDETQEFKVDINTTWRVLGLDDTNNQLLIVSGSPIKKSGDNPYFILEGAEGYAYGEYALNRICKLYYNKQYATKARSITIEDIDRILNISPEPKDIDEFDFKAINKMSINTFGENKTNYLKLSNILDSNSNELDFTPSVNSKNDSVNFNINSIDINEYYGEDLREQQAKSIKETVKNYLDNLDTKYYGNPIIGYDNEEIISFGYSLCGKTYTLDSEDIACENYLNQIGDFTPMKKMPNEEIDLTAYTYTYMDILDYHLYKELLFCNASITDDESLMSNVGLYWLASSGISDKNFYINDGKMDYDVNSAIYSMGATMNMRLWRHSWKRNNTFV